MMRVRKQKDAWKSLKIHRSRVFFNLEIQTVSLKKIGVMLIEKRCVAEDIGTVYFPHSVLRLVGELHGLYSNNDCKVEIYL